MKHPREADHARLSARGTGRKRADRRLGQRDFGYMRSVALRESRSGGGRPISSCATARANARGRSLNAGNGVIATKEGFGTGLAGDATMVWLREAQCWE